LWTLTSREKELLRRLAKEKTDKQIAYELGDTKRSIDSSAMGSKFDRKLAAIAERLAA
jgi:FixJ family two-component response regulator